MLTPNDFLLELRRRGVKRVSRVSFRLNRNVVWSLTQNGTVLNVHAAYRAATPALLDAFATVVREGGIGSAKSKRAAAIISDWPALESAMNDAMKAYRKRIPEGVDVPAHNCATPEQQTYLRALYRYFNHTRFDGSLPDGVPVRLSNRMKSALGHMLPGETPGRGRYVVEIALNVDLMLAGNGAERIDTLLHEMAHVADYLRTGHRGHGPSWQAWARYAGCRPEPLYDRPVVYRRRRRDRVTRVPPLPPAVERLGTLLESDVRGRDVGNRRRAVGKGGDGGKPRDDRPRGKSKDSSTPARASRTSQPSKGRRSGRRTST